MKTFSCNVLLLKFYCQRLTRLSILKEMFLDDVALPSQHPSTNPSTALYGWLTEADDAESDGEIRIDPG